MRGQFMSTTIPLFSFSSSNSFDFLSLMLSKSFSMKIACHNMFGPKILIAALPTALAV